MFAVCRDRHLDAVPAYAAGTWSIPATPEANAKSTRLERATSG